MIENTQAFTDLQGAFRKWSRGEVTTDGELASMRLALQNTLFTLEAMGEHGVIVRGLRLELISVENCINARREHEERERRRSQSGS